MTESTVRATRMRPDDALRNYDPSDARDIYSPAMRRAALEELEEQHTTAREEGIESVITAGHPMNRSRYESGPQGRQDQVRDIQKIDELMATFATAVNLFSGACGTGVTLLAVTVAASFYRLGFIVISDCLEFGFRIDKDVHLSSIRGGLGTVSGCLTT